MAGTGIPRPFTIAIPDAALDDLRHRLRTARRPVISTMPTGPSA